MDYQNNNFISNKFHWFTGVVEDVYDPYEMGRVKVRCFGYHTENTNRESGLPTQKLPWAHVMMPITSASCSGIGESATGVVPGSWVVGFFRDGEACQDPLVMGTIPSRTPRSKAEGEVGFRDPYGENPKNDNDIDNPRQSRSQYVETTSFKERNDSVDETKYINDKTKKKDGVPTAIPPTTDTLKNVLKKDDKFFETQRWIHKEQKEVCHPSYPLNHVKNYNCGHVVEFDETPNKERIVIQHKAGTFDQIDASGDKTTIIQGNNYQVIIEDQNVNIKGACNLTVDGDVRTRCKNYYLEVQEDYHLLIHGNKHEKIVMSDFLEVSKNQQIKIDGHRIDTVDKSAKYVVACTHELDSPKTIDYQLHVKRNLNEKINGDGVRFVSKNYKQQVLGKLTELSNTKIDTVDGNYKIEVAPSTSNNTPGILDIDAIGKITIDTTNDIDLHAGTEGTVDIDGPTAINLN